MLVPLAIGVYGLVAIVRQRIWLVRKEITDAAAVGYGIMLVSAAVLMHFRGFWGRRGDTWWQQAGLLISGLGMIGGFGLIVARFARWI